MRLDRIEIAGICNLIEQLGSDLSQLSTALGRDAFVAEPCFDLRIEVGGRLEDCIALDGG